MALSRAPSVSALPPSATKERFCAALGIDTHRSQGLAVYMQMKDEAIQGRNQLSLESGTPWAKLSETDKHRVILQIYYTAAHTGALTTQYYDCGRYVSGQNEENWVIRWMLWHVFRYRDDRNKKSKSHSGDARGGRGGPSNKHGKMPPLKALIDFQSPGQDPAQQSATRSGGLTVIPRHFSSVRPHSAVSAVKSA